MSPLMRIVRTNPFMIPVGTLLLFLPWLVLLGWMADASWFLTDDAFISFRYVRNLLEGHGLVFNRGERVEGYSNFLWVLELALLWGVFGLRPEHAAPWLSVAFTAGTIAAMLWWVARLPALRHRVLVGWMALGLVCSSATFAVWTSGGGLETRQFTFFVVAAVVCLSLYRGSRRALLVVSLSLAAAALTRPEGPLFALCCFAWYAVQRRVDPDGGGDWRAAACLAVPFVVLVAGHYLFRYSYYGEWLPNTYYAKHVRPWYEMGLRYLWAAALETGLYLLLPLAVVSLIKGWRGRRCLTYALPLLCIVSHMGYVARVGGDHFEYRPLDFYWPLLAVPAAVGIVHLGSWISIIFRRMAVGTRIYALILFLPVLFYSNAMQGALLFEGAKIKESIWKIHLTLGKDNVGWLLAVPGMSMLTAISDSLRPQLIRQSIGMRSVEHRNYASMKLRRWQIYENMERDVIPADAVYPTGNPGIQGYYIPDVTIIDQKGLTDATIARNPVTRSNHERHMAHDRRPPPGYNEKRGTNISIYPASLGERPEAFCGSYTMKVGHGLWMPFYSSEGYQWLAERFAEQQLRRMYLHPTSPPLNRLTYDDKTYIGDRFLQHFEDGIGDLSLEGDAFAAYGVYKGGYRGRKSYHYIGQGFLASYHPTEGDGAVGRALFPEFTVRGGRLLAFCITGSNGADVGVRLLADGQQVAVWHAKHPTDFNMIVHPLDSVSGKRLRLEIFDHGTGNGDFIMLDHVLILRQTEESARDVLNRIIDESGHPIIRSNYDVYYNRSHGLVYVKEQCRREDREPYTFLYVIPVDPAHDRRFHPRQYYDNLDFRSSDFIQSHGETCVIIRSLPDYPIAAIRTGQVVRAGEAPTWKGSFNFTEQSGNAAQ